MACATILLRRLLTCTWETSYFANFGRESVVRTSFRWSRDVRSVNSPRSQAPSSSCGAPRCRMEALTNRLVSTTALSGTEPLLIHLLTNLLHDLRHLSEYLIRIEM